MSKIVPSKLIQTATNGNGSEESDLEQLTTEESAHDLLQDADLCTVVSHSVAKY
jgi:hypothetical protein